MALSTISADAPQCTDPAKHDVSTASLQKVLIKLGFRVDDFEVFSNNLITIVAFLDPWITDREGYVINTKFNGEELNKGGEKLDELLEHVKRRVKGHIHETSRSRENSSGHPHLIRLFASLVESMMAPGGHHDNVFENGNVWLPETCAVLRSLIIHFKFEHVHGYGVSSDTVEKLKPLPWLEGPEGAFDENEEATEPQPGFSEEDDVSRTFEQSDPEGLKEIDAGDHQEVDAEEKDDEMETGEDNRYCILHPVLQALLKEAKSTTFGEDLFRRARYVPKTSLFNDLESSICRSTAKNSKSKLPVEQGLDYVAVRKMLGGEIPSVLPVVEFKVDKKVMKTDEFVCPTPLQLQAVTLTSIPVEVEKHIINLGAGQQDNEEEKKQERLFTYPLSMFDRDSNAPLPVLVPIVINDNFDSSLSSLPDSQASTSPSFPRLTGLLSTLSLPQQPRTPRRHKANPPLYRQLSTPRPLPEIGFFDAFAQFSPLPTEDPFIEQEGFVSIPVFKRPRPRNNHGSSMLSRLPYHLENSPPTVNTTCPGQAPGGSPTKVRAKLRISGLGYTNHAHDPLHTFRSDDGKRVVDLDAGPNNSSLILLEDKE